MKVAVIAPTAYLHSYAGMSSYHLVLAHIYEEDALYRDYYKQRVAEGDFVILDNSAYELGGSVALARLEACANDLNPSAVFLPDTRFNARETKWQVMHALERFAGRPWKNLAVPQGNDLGEVLAMLDWYATQRYVHGIGLYEEIGTVCGFENRVQFLRYIDGTDLPLKKWHVHLLGMEEDVKAVADLAKISWVDGIDSAKPVVYGLNGIRILPEGAEKEYPHRPKGYFEIDTVDYKNDRIIEQNIRQLQIWAQQRA